MSLYTLKPALLRSPQTYRIDSGILSRLDKDDPWDLSLSSVRYLAYAEVTTGKTVSRYLDIDTDEGTRRLAQTTDTSDPAEDFQALVVAVLTALNDINPRLEIAYGVRGRARSALFGIGVVSLLAGIGLPLAALLSGASGARIGAALAPSLMLAALGGLFVWTNRPWKPLPRLTLGAVIDALDLSGSATRP